MAGVNGPSAERSSARPYRSPLRTRQAAASRAAVLAAARELFVAQGYGATTIEQVAARAGVSKPTVFNSVGNKQALLAAVRDVAMAGDDEPVPVSERPSVRAAREESDPHRAVQRAAEHISAVASRYAPIHEVLRGAAASGEPSLRRLWNRAEEERLIGAGHIVASLKAKRRLACSDAAAADVLWLLMDPSAYTALVTRRGWTEKRFTRWLTTTIAANLLPPE